MAKIYDFKTTSNRGAEVDLAQYEGKVLMVVNTASKCGFTPQYDGLEALYQKYKDQGLVIIGFPCDQFAGQEPGSNDEIAEFCRLNHGVTFPLMAKTDVNGDNAEPVFEYLKAQSSSAMLPPPSRRISRRTSKQCSNGKGRVQTGKPALLPALLRFASHHADLPSPAH